MGVALLRKWGGPVEGMLEQGVKQNAGKALGCLPRQAHGRRGTFTVYRGGAYNANIPASKTISKEMGAGF